MMRVVGLDLSLTSTGIAWIDGHATVVKPRTRGNARLVEIRRAVGEAVYGDDYADLVVLEDFLESQPSSGRVGLLHGVIRVALFDLGRPMLFIPPTTLKVFATGRGGATKADMVEAAQSDVGYSGFDDNCADAIWLRQLGLHLAGQADVHRTEVHTRALAKLSLPLAVGR